MKPILFLSSLLLCATFSVAQTKTIFEKSHSNNQGIHVDRNPGNFGLSKPLPVTDSIVKVDPNTVVFHSHYAFNNYTDTIRGDKNWENINVDSLQQRYPGTKLIGFEQSLSNAGQPIRKNKNSTPAIILLIGCTLFLSFYFKGNLTFQKQG